MTPFLAVIGMLGFSYILLALYDDWRHPAHRYEGWR